jgi:type I restriction enzyme, S subunit
MRLNIGSLAFNDFERSILVSPDYVVFRARPGVASPDFVNQLRYSSYWTGFMKRAGAGSVRVRIYFSDLAHLRVPSPEPDEQNRIAEVLKLVDSEISRLEQLQELIENKKFALLSRLLSDDLAVPSP